jgi:hypothetical protein
MTPFLLRLLEGRSHWRKWSMAIGGVFVVAGAIGAAFAESVGFKHARALYGQQLTDSTGRRSDCPPRCLVRHWERSTFRTVHQSYR